MLQSRRLSRSLKWKPTESNLMQLKALQEIFVLSKGFSPLDSNEVNMDIAQLTASKNICLKKLVYLYVALSSHCCEDIILHVMNSVASDLTDPNAIVRRATLYSVNEFSVNSEVNLEFAYKSILQGLVDHAASVRCTAVNGIIQLYHKKSDYLKQNGKELIVAALEKVYITINNDPDPSVVIRCLECLSSCDAKTEFLNPAIVSLLTKVSLLDPSLVLILLHRAAVSLNLSKIEGEEIFKLLNKLERLRTVNTHCSMTIKTCSVMLKLTNNFGDVQNDVILELIKTLIALLSVCNKHAKYFILCNLYDVLKVYCALVQENIISNMLLFLLWDQDDSYVLVKKLQILNYCVLESTAADIFFNIRPYFFKFRSCFVVKEAFRLLKTLYKYLPQQSENVVWAGLYSDASVVVDCAVTLLHYVTTNHTQANGDIFVTSKIASALLNCHKHLSLQEAKCCFLVLISSITDSASSKDILKVLKTELAHFCDNSSLCYQYCVLVVLLRSFLRWPRLFQHLVKELFTRLLKNPKNNFVVQQAKMFHQLLQKDHKQLKLLLNSTVTLPCVKMSISQTHAIKILLDDVQAAAMTCT